MAPLLASADPRTDFFESRVRPLLAARCYSCHTDVRTSGLRVDSRDALLKGGNRGPAIVPGDPARSLLAAAVEHRAPGLHMPPQGRLADTEIAAIATWIRDGAIWPTASAPVRQAERAVTEADRDFWSLKPIRNPGGSIDSLVRARLARQGLTPNPAADHRTLIRRLSFDLTGLPPEPADFDLDYETAAGRMLASPHFGERWGRYWLDVARFGEEDYTGTAPRFYPNAWRYRDWVIGAFNRDLPYDVFVKAQLAADLMPGADPSLTGGLGLFGFGPWYYGISQPPQARSDERHDRVDMVTRGFLGLTGACARCHDHKYDPITMRDYYSVAAVFHNSQYEEYPLVDASIVKQYKNAQAAVKAQQAKIAKLLDARRDELAGELAHTIAETMVAAAMERSSEDTGMDCDLLDRFSRYLAKPEEEFPYLKPWHDAVARGAAEPELRRIGEEFQARVISTAARKKKLDAENDAAREAAKARLPKHRKVVLPGGYDSEADFNPGADVPVKSLDPQDMYLWRRFYLGRDGLLRFEDDRIERFVEGPRRAELGALRAELERLKKASPPAYGFHQGLAEHEERVDLPMNVRGDPFQDGEPVGPRFLTVLSTGTPPEWRNGSGRLELAEAIVQSPIAARVMANRVWTQLLGAGIVATPSNFGRSGARPSNPELLEYLSWRLAHGGWSVKKLILEIVRSDTYRASSKPSQANDQADAANTLFWRANRRRLDAEAYRDSILSVCGTLDRRAGGESDPLNDSMQRRTVYARVSRFQQDETLSLFDFPSASVSVEKRASTNVPLQKLYLLNSPFLLRQSEALGRRMRELGVTASYLRIFGRPAAEAELRMAEEFLRQAGPDGWTRYAQVLLSSNEFAFID
ncbi:MAG: DUF1553 domain-containing protein [Acidobacteria bacterium]|nr:DUF1553 domain-containing protein [Acidobacteriota bacterium]